ncbi:MAG TPA: cupin domain-containing protein [Steroidobacteraceae bacterium]|nr:cupin domain-containing protein [Steroidobacteraceae bacterium]
MSGPDPKRRIFRIAAQSLRPYDLDGPLQPEMGWAPLSYDPATGRGSYVMRMAPGAATIPHVHEAREEYLILEGEAIEADGTVLKPGDWVVYEPGSAHGTRTETGCLLLGLDWDPS